MTHEEAINRLWEAVIESHGGEPLERILRAYFVDRRTMADIGREHGLTASCVHRRIHKFRAVMQPRGLMPAAWLARDRVHSRRRE